MLAPVKLWLGMAAMSKRSLPMKRRFAFIACIHLMACALGGCTPGIFPSPSPQPQPSLPRPIPVVSSFETGDEGWELIGGAFAGATSPIWNSEEKYVYAIDVQFAYWTAPAAYLGNFSTAYGRFLEFDAAWEDDCCSPDPHVILAGGGITLVHRPVYPARRAGSSFLIRLEESEQWYDYATGARATEADIRLALGNMTQLRLRAGDSGYSWIDNVRFGSTTPLPQTGPISSDFASGAGGWRIAGGAIRLLSQPSHNGATGSIYASDAEFASWIAPREFSGNFLAMAGSRLTFDAAWDDRCCSGEARVVLYGGGHEIFWSPDADPAPTGSSLGVNLDQSGVWRTVGHLATRDEILQVLENLQLVRLLTGDSRVSSLSRVSLGSP